MKSFFLIICLLVIIGCSIVPINRDYIRPIPPDISTNEKQVKVPIDVTNDIQEILMIVGTDDSFIGINSEEFYIRSINLWALEISEVIKSDFVIFMSHGVSFAGMWVCENGPDNYQPVEVVVHLIRKNLPENAQEIPIVLLVCNPWAYEIMTDKNVWYVKENIYMTPTKYLSEESKELRKNDKKTVDSFNKFINTNNLY